MAQRIPGLHFDKQDHELLRIVNDVLARQHSRKSFRSLLAPHMHPNGMKEMAAPKELRIANAVIHLLEMLEAGGSQERLTALRSVRDEVLHCGQSEMRINTGRVLLQIMKELVRSKNNPQRQLELAHDFRTVATGKPRVVRSHLKRYHLLEMPEAWNQVTFDDHVHDANTKGRKSPTHLIMDAWIKGIRTLTVIYYNHIRPSAAAELLEAAEIMGVQIRIGIEFSAWFRDRYIQLIWSPRGFTGTQEFIQFLSQPEMSALMNEGRQASEYQQRHVFQIFEAFNFRHLPKIISRFGLDLAPLSRDDFIQSVGVGQPSLLHLAKYIHDKLLPAMQARVAEIKELYRTVDEEHQARLRSLVDEMNLLDTYKIQQDFLSPSANPDLALHAMEDETPIPSLLTYSPCTLARRLATLHATYRITLNLTDIRTEDLIEILYECMGHITHLEIFNLKDHVQQKTTFVGEINELQRAINEGNILRLKQLIRKVIQRVENSDLHDKLDRVQKLTAALSQIGALCDAYRGTPLGSRIGSDSTGQSTVVPGMGLAVTETLPQRAQRELSRDHLKEWMRIPMRRDAFLRVTYLHARSFSKEVDTFYRLARRLPGLRFIGMRKQEDWVADNSSTRMDAHGNIISLGGVRAPGSNGLSLDEPQDGSQGYILDWDYLNSGVKNVFKVLLGFIPAFISFALTKDWWLLAYFGAVIWFGITGFRNIIQSVLGGGGFRRTPLVHWKNYVSWNRLADSLMFTGFSVPLLDYLVKTVLLDEGMGINTGSNPVALYSIIALANGFYISGHNALRGLPKGAIYGNFFRTILSIPLALFFNFLAGSLLGLGGATATQDILQKWAAIISKAASDFVAGVIEGFADRYSNLTMRAWDYSGKLKQVFEVFANLELLFPESDVAEMLSDPENFFKAVNIRSPELGKVLIVNAVDLLYFWMYQPRARTCLRAIIRTMSDEERRVLESSQFILKLNLEVSQMFVNGLVGERFGKPLAFYLDRWEEYLSAFHKMITKVPRPDGKNLPRMAPAYEACFRPSMYL